MHSHFEQLKKNLQETRIGKSLTQLLRRSRDTHNETLQKTDVLSDTSAEIYTRFPDNIARTPEQNAFNAEAIQKLKGLVRYQLEAEADKKSDRRKYDRALELIESDTQVSQSLLRLNLAMQRVPELMQLLDIRLLQKSQNVQVSKDTVSRHFERIRAKLQTKGILFRHHPGQTVGFDDHFQPDNKSTNHAKMRKEGENWNLYTNEQSYHDPLEISHELYGHLFKRVIRNESEIIEIQARNLVDTRVSDIFFATAADPTISKIMMTEGSPFETARVVAGYLPVFRDKS